MLVVFLLQLSAQLASNYIPGDICLVVYRVAHLVFQAHFLVIFKIAKNGIAGATAEALSHTSGLLLWPKGPGVIAAAYNTCCASAVGSAYPALPKGHKDETGCLWI